MERIRILETITLDDSSPGVETEVVESPKVESLRIEALSRTVKEEFEKIIDASPYLPYERKIDLVNISDPGGLSDFIGANLNLLSMERQQILSLSNIELRLSLITRFIKRELQLQKLSHQIHSEVSGTIEKNQREYFLREQLKAIQKELGEDKENADIRELKEKIADLKAPEMVIEAANKQVNRLERISTTSPEYTVTRTYIDWILDIPWSVSTEDRIDIDKARKILDEQHYGLEDVKERITEFLAVHKLKGGGGGSIICFVGPPGVGKTSIGNSIACAMGRRFIRMSLGGMRDEAEIRGHRRTYIGALPGRIIQNIKRAGSNNPVFMLDEIDKLGSDYHGDPSSAMLEVLDPEQNHAFQDNYLELDFDLSKVMFITTANYIETIPLPLRDRMEIIKLPGYITTEKVQISKRFLVPRQLEENGIKAANLRFSLKALENIIVHYTHEAGVRTLERKIGKICRKVAIKIAKGEFEKHFITVKNLAEYLGPRRIMPTLFNKKPKVGIANGLAWTAIGGVMLVIEVISMPGQGKIKITGQLGDVMKESAEIAMSYIRKNADNLGIKRNFFEINDLHIHIPEGATPKDGPSAGITLATAMASLFTGKAVLHDIAMTGEITLQGKVLPIGGLREKSVAAARGRMKAVICPKANSPDLEDIPMVVKDKLDYFFVDTVEEVFEKAFA